MQSTTVKLLWFALAGVLALLVLVLSVTGDMRYDQEEEIQKLEQEKQQLNKELEVKRETKLAEAKRKDKPATAMGKDKIVAEALQRDTRITRSHDLAANGRKTLGKSRDIADALA